MLINRQPAAEVIGAGRSIAKTVDDQITVTGVLENDAVACIHYRGGVSRGVNLLWEMNGTEGDLQIVDPAGHGQSPDQQILGGRGNDAGLAPLPVPSEYYEVSRSAAPGLAYNVAQHYLRLSRDMREGGHSCPTFEDALVRHRMLDAIQRSAGSGRPERYERFGGAWSL
jgi:predicted dehydrogenase